METIVIALEPEEDMLQAILEALARESVANAVVLSGVGTLSRVMVSKVGHCRPQKHDGIVDLLSLQGIIADGEASVYLSAANVQGTFGGRLLTGTMVDTAAEVVLGRLEQSLERRSGELHPKE